MNIFLPKSNKFTITKTGLEVRSDLDFDEWASLAILLSEASRGVSFAIGDWLVYGLTRFGTPEASRDGTKSEGKRLTAPEYEAVVRITGLDRTTLHTYAHVSRKVPPSLRNKDLSWEHHKVVAKLPPADQKAWLQVADESREGGRPVSTRRLRRSIQAGRLLDPEEVELPESDRGIENHIPFVNRLVAWWARMQDKHWLDRATKEQREAVRRDLEPLISIYEEL